MIVEYTYILHYIQLVANDIHIEIIIFDSRYALVHRWQNYVEITKCVQMNKTDYKKFDQIQM